MDQASWGGYVRHNAIWRRVFDREGNFLEDQPLFTNDAIMMYSPFCRKWKNKKGPRKQRFRGPFCGLTRCD